MRVCMYACMYVLIYAYVYVYKYVCMYVWMDGWHNSGVYINFSLVLYQPDDSSVKLAESCRSKASHYV